MGETDKQHQPKHSWVRWFGGCAIAASVGFALLFGAVYLLDRAFPTEFEATAKDYTAVKDLRLLTWLPDNLPRSVRDLSIRWDIDVGSADATFSIAPEDIEYLVQGFELLEPDSNDVGRFRQVHDQSSGRFSAERVDTLIVNRTTGKVEWSTKRNYL